MTANMARGCIRQMAHARPIEHPSTVVYIPIRKLANSNIPITTKKDCNSFPVMADVTTPINRASIQTQHPNAEACSAFEYSLFLINLESTYCVTSSTPIAAPMRQYSCRFIYHTVDTTTSAPTIPMDRQSEKYLDEGLSRVRE